jgi:hypothetical protein
MRYSSAKSKSGSVHETAPRYYEWKPQGRPLSIQLSLAVIDRLETDIMKGFWAVPKRGMEVGGVLFGRIEPGVDTVVVIDDYEPVSCEHRRGPSYALSEPDRKRLEKILRRSGRQVAGFYRSHTRLGLYLDQDDMGVIDSYFANPSHVILLVRPDATKPGTAGFFFREEGEIHRQSTYLEFPFKQAELQKQSGIAIEETGKPEKQALALPAPRPRNIPQFRWKPAGAIAAGLLAFGTLEYQVITRLRQPEIAAADFAPSLSIEPNGSYLQVNWKRNAAAVLKAERGILSITEGTYRQDLNLDGPQLRTGAVVYAPKGNDVNFRLDLLEGRTTVTESLRFVSAPKAKEPEHVAVTPPPPQEVKKQEPVEAKARPRRRAFFDDGL